MRIMRFYCFWAGPHSVGELRAVGRPSASLATNGETAIAATPPFYALSPQLYRCANVVAYLSHSPRTTRFSSPRPATEAPLPRSIGASNCKPDPLSGLQWTVTSRSAMYAATALPMVQEGVDGIREALWVGALDCEDNLIVGAGGQRASARDEKIGGSALHPLGDKESAAAKSAGAHRRPKAAAHRPGPTNLPRSIPVLTGPSQAFRGLWPATFTRN